MTVYYYTIFALFAILCYMIVVDKNVALFIDLSVRYAKVQLQRLWWMIQFHPANPIARWTLERRIAKMTRELEKQLKVKDNDSV